MKLCFRPLIFFLSVLWMTGAQAHDGPHGPDVLAEVVSAKSTGQRVVVKLLITNFGGPLALNSINADGAKRTSVPPIPLKFAEDTIVAATLLFNHPPKEVFKLVLGFDVVGQVVVLVKPEVTTP